MGEAIITRRGGGIIISGQTEITTIFGGTISRNDAVHINNNYGNAHTKLADPATLPTGQGNGVSFSTDGTYMSVAHRDAPYVTIYKRSGDVFTKLADPASLPPGEGNGVSFSTDGTYMSVVHSDAPYVTIYKRSGDVFTKLADPATLPTNISFGVSFSTDGIYMSVAHFLAPYVTIYKRSGDAWQKAYKSNNLLDEVSGIDGYGYAKENGTSGETKQVIKLWG